MPVLYYAPSACLEHDPNPGHPDSPDRLRAIAQAVQGLNVQVMPSRPASRDDLLLAHEASYIDHVFATMPTWGLNFFDADTAVSEGSGDAALAAAGAVLQAVDDVLHGKWQRAFCAVRPPGHHAHRGKAAGFCLFNNVVIGARAALQHHGLSRVAILDFDVHHGDGTQDIIWDDGRIFFAQTFQDQLYSARAETQQQTGAHNNILNIALPAGTDGADVIAVWRDGILPRVMVFKPDLILVSTGFDAHRDDPLGELNMTTQDFAELVTLIRACADQCCGGKLVAVLEGGYNLNALADSVAACLHVLRDDK